MPPRVDPRVPALFGIVAISFSAIWVRIADVSPGTATFFRPLYALPALALVYYFTRGEDARRPRDRWLAFAAGALLAADFEFWHLAIPLVGAGLATVLANLQVVVVAVLAWALHGERPSRAAFLGVPVAFGGVVLTTGLGRADAYGADPVLGAVFGVGAALAYTGFLMLFRASGRSGGSPAGLLLDATAGAAIFGFFIALATDPAFSLTPSWPAHGWLLVMALFSQAGGWLLIAYTLPRVPALATSVLLLMQPTLTIVWAFLLFREIPSPLQWAGVALVLTGVGLVSWHGAAREEAEEAPDAEPAAA